MRHFTARAQGAVAVLLCLVAGFVDAIAFLSSDVFVANMTGNTVLIGISLARGDWSIAAIRLATVLGFFLGAVAGRIVLNLAQGRQWAPLVVEAVLLGLALVPGLGDWRGVLCLAVAMGVQATAATQFGGVAINTVVVTSAIARVSERVADHVSGLARTPSPAPAQGRMQAMAWISYLAGAALAAVSASLPWAMALPAVALASLSAGLLLRRR